MANHNTEQEFATAIKDCREIFEKKLKDYGAAWRILRPSSLTDQILIKASRIRSLETKGEAMVNRRHTAGIRGHRQLWRGGTDTTGARSSRPSRHIRRRGALALRQMDWRDHTADARQKPRLRRGVATDARQLIHRHYPVETATHQAD